MRKAGTFNDLVGRAFNSRKALMHISFINFFINKKQIFDNLTADITYL